MQCSEACCLCFDALFALLGAPAPQLPAAGERGVVSGEDVLLSLADQRQVWPVHAAGSKRPRRLARRSL